MTAWSSLGPDAGGTRPEPVAPPVLVEVVRDGFVESRHRGDVVAVGPDGAVVFAVGEPDGLVLPRSAAKPLQAAAMVRIGLPLDGELLALAVSSHSGEEFHLEGVRRILAGAGLDEDALGCPPSWPFDPLAAMAYARRGLDPAPIAHPCSGKHAAMLATCVARAWPVEDYLYPHHPLQVAVREEVEAAADEAIGHLATDGCGAPLLGISLHGLAHAFARLVGCPLGSPQGQVVDAVRAHPEWTSGTDRDEARLMRAVPGLVAKMGAEAIYVAALADGRAVALTVEDGGDRARPVVMAMALRRLGVEHAVLDELGRPPVLGGGHPVGELRSTW